MYVCHDQEHDFLAIRDNISQRLESLILDLHLDAEEEDVLFLIFGETHMLNIMYLYL